MTREQSRTLGVGERVCWRATTTDQGTVTETNWAGVTVKWDSRSVQAATGDFNGATVLRKFGDVPVI